MTREDVIRIARASGCHDNGTEFRFVELRYLERFAALVAAHEREECAKVCDHRFSDGALVLAAEIRARR